jgi:hypothetical protein
MSATGLATTLRGPAFSPVEANWFLVVTHTSSRGVTDLAIVKASDVDFHYPAIGVSRTQGLVAYDDFQSMNR